MSAIPSQSENPNGLHNRYYIQKFTGKYIENFFGDRVPELVNVDTGSEYFVLRLDEGGSDMKHIAACRIGIHAYADAIKDHLPELSKDLIERYPLIVG